MSPLGVGQPPGSVDYALSRPLSLPEMTHETRPCPDCAGGKHDNCDASAWCLTHDALEVCPCWARDHA